MIRYQRAGFAYDHFGVTQSRLPTKALMSQGFQRPGVPKTIVIKFCKIICKCFGIAKKIVQIITTRFSYGNIILKYLFVNSRENITKK